MATRSAVSWASLRWLAASALIHAGSLGLLLGTGSEPSDRSPPWFLRSAPAPLSLPDAPGVGEAALGDLEPVDWDEWIEECDGGRLAPARPVPDCGWPGLVCACRHGPDVPDFIGTPWTIGIGPGGEGRAWARHPPDEDAAIVSISLAAGTDGVFLESGSPPASPDDARRAGVSGRVELNVEVDETGRSLRVPVARSIGHAVLDEAAVEAARAWTWSHPGPWTGRVVVQFRNARRPRR